MTASIHSIQADLDKIIKPLLKEIKELLENLNENKTSTSEIVEAAAAKIISEMKNCHCNKEILDALHSKDTERIVVPKQDKEEGYNKLYLYSYPNSSVGNEELGTGKNPKSLTWPFGSHTSK